MVVSADDRLDEISISSRTHIIEINEGHTEELFVKPADFGLEQADLPVVAGGSPEQNARISRAVLSGEPGATRDLTLLNAGAAIYVRGVASSFGEGVGEARLHWIPVPETSFFVD